MSSSNCCFLTCIQISQEAGQVIWYSHPLKNFKQFVVIHIVKGFSVVNETEIDVLTGHYMNSKYMSKSFQVALYYFFFLMFTYYGCAGSLLLADFSCSCCKRGIFSSCGAQASYCCGFSCCKAQALGPVGFSSCCSRVHEHRLNGCGTLLCRSKACGMFLGQGSNSCRLHWQVDSLPLSHQEALPFTLDSFCME